MDVTCPKCGIKLSRNSNLLRHMRTRHYVEDRERFTFDECGESFSKKSHLRQHLSTQHSSEDRGKFMCVECGKSFTRRHSLKLHSAVLHSTSDPAWFQCAVCRRSFRWQYNFNRHIKSSPCASELLAGTHPPEILSSETPSSSSQRSPSPLPKYECAKCGISYKYQKNLISHLFQFHNATDPQTATSTPLPGSSSSSLTQPSTSTSGQCPPPPPPASPPSNYMCIYCKKSYSCRGNLVRHARSSHNAFGSEICVFCGETFSSKQDLSRHLNLACFAVKECRVLQPRSTKSAGQIDSTDKLEETERSGENTLCEEDLEAATILMTMSRAPTSTAVPPNSPLLGSNDVPKTPPYLPARMQRCLHEESFDQDVTTSSSSGSLADVYAIMEACASDSSTPTED